MPASRSVVRAFMESIPSCPQAAPCSRFLRSLDQRTQPPHTVLPHKQWLEEQSPFFTKLGAQHRSSHFVRLLRQPCQYVLRSTNDSTWVLSFILSAQFKSLGFGAIRVVHRNELRPRLPKRTSLTWWCTLFKVVSESNDAVKESQICIRAAEGSKPIRFQGRVCAVS
jgi:hypothetical protein